jgi:hypothetical protein
MPINKLPTEVITVSPAKSMLRVAATAAAAAAAMPLLEYGIPHLDGWLGDCLQRLQCIYHDYGSFACGSEMPGTATNCTADKDANCLLARALLGLRMLP